MQAARHVTAENVLKYVGARLAIKNVYNNQPVGTCTENNISDWKSPYLGRDGASEMGH
jgi:hypothetical protein